MGAVPGRADHRSDLAGLRELHNRQLSRDRGVAGKGQQVRWTQYDGAEPSVNGSTATTGRYTFVLRNTGGNHMAVLLSATDPDATPSATNSVMLVQDSGVTLVGATDLVVGGNLSWKSGTAFLVTLDHNATADRVITVPDATGTMALLEQAQTWTGVNTFSNAAPLILSATAARIRGLFGDATRANRPFFQSSATNGDTNVNAMPSGTNTVAKFEAYNNATPGSATAVASLEANATEVRLTASFASGSGLPLQLWAGGNKAIEAAITGALTFALQPRVRAFNSTLISHTTSATWQTLTFDSERYDVGAMHSLSVSTSRLTVPSAGSYRMGGCVSFAGSATGARGIRILLNGATIIAEQFWPAAAINGNVAAIATEYDLAAADFIELQAWQDSGGALNMTLIGSAAPEFWASRYA